MAFPLVPALAVLFLGGGAALAVKKRQQKNPERRLIFEAAMTQLKDADDLRTLADVFEKEGVKDWAEALRGRAKLRDLPADVKKQRRDIFYEALGSTDVKFITGVAAAFEKEHATGAAAKLREYADGLKKAGTAAAPSATAPAAGAPPAAKS